MIKNRIIYDVNTGVVLDIIVPQILIVGQDNFVEFSLEFMDGLNKVTNINWQVVTIFERPDGEKSNKLLATLTGDAYIKKIPSWATDIEGILKITTQIIVGGVVRPLGIALIPVEEGLEPANDTITEAQYQLLTSELNGLNNKIEAHQNRVDNPHQVTKVQVGLGNVDPTSDIDKPVSTAQKTYIDTQDNALGGRIDDLETDNTQNKADILALETFKDVTVPSTYETIVNVGAKVQGAKNYADNGLSLKENLSNKAINLSDVNDIKYPTTQAVKTEIDKKVNKTQTIIGIDLQDNILIGEFKTALGNATSLTSGLMTSQDKTHLDNLVSLLDTNDMNSVVDTIGEILHIFENYPEGANILEVLNDKVVKIEGKGLSENDYTDIDKNKVNLSYTHREIADGSNPHNTKFINIADKPTTRDGYGITDVYTKPEIYTQQEINALFDNLSAVKGLKSTLLTPTELSNGDTISTNLLTNNGAYIVFTATDTSTEEIDSDTVPVSTIITGKKFVFFDNQEIVFTIGETNSTFETSENITLKINLLYLDHDSVQAIGVDFYGSLTNYLLSQTNVQEAIEKIDNELKTTNDNIDETEADILALETANMIKSITRSGSNLFTITYYDDTTSGLLTLAELKSFIGEATQSLSGLMSAQDKVDLDTLMALFDSDADSVVNTIQEILDIFENYPEGADLVTELAGKVDKTSIVDNVTTNDATKVLSAKQGKELNDTVALKVNTSDIVNNLTSTDTNKPLSANQGKALKDLVDAIPSGVDVSIWRYE